MQIIPLNSVPSQNLLIVLNNQLCQINVYTKLYGTFLDLYISNTLIIAGVLCQNLRPLIISPYLGFIGDLSFTDSQGTNDPVYTGFGSQGRFQLMYLAPSDLPAQYGITW